MFPVNLEISIEGIRVINRVIGEELMSYPLVNISYVADCGSLLVIMAFKDSAGGAPSTPQSPGMPAAEWKKMVKIGCHVFDTPKVNLKSF